MSHGKTTTMLGLRIKDTLMDRLDKKCKEIGVTRSELLIPLIDKFITGGQLASFRPGMVKAGELDKSGPFAWREGTKVEQFRWVVVSKGGVKLKKSADGWVDTGREYRWIRDEGDGAVVREITFGKEKKVLWSDMGPILTQEEIEFRMVAPSGVEKSGTELHVYDPGELDDDDRYAQELKDELKGIV